MSDPRCYYPLLAVMGASAILALVPWFIADLVLTRRARSRGLTQRDRERYYPLAELLAGRAWPIRAAGKYVTWLLVMAALGGGLLRWRARVDDETGRSSPEAVARAFIVSQGPGGSPCPWIDPSILASAEGATLMDWGRSLARGATGGFVGAGGQGGTQVRGSVLNRNPVIRALTLVSAQPESAVVAATGTFEPYSSEGNKGFTFRERPFSAELGLVRRDGRWYVLSIR